MAKITKNTEQVNITPPDFREVTLHLVGTAPYVQLRFSEKAKAQMAAAMTDPGRKKRGAVREARDFDNDFHQAYYRTQSGQYGIPVMALKNALIEAGVLVGVTKTTIRKTIFIQPDGLDEQDATPLLFIVGDGPHSVTHHVRNAMGVADLRVRAMWRTWRAETRLIYDASILRLEDVIALMHRAGLQVGIGEGRPASKQSAGMGWGTFALDSEE